MIYADQIRRLVDRDLEIETSEEMKDLSQYDKIYVYHGNDWGGTLNLFGGLKEYTATDRFERLTHYKGIVYSLQIPFPDYAGMIKDRLDKATAKGDKVQDGWLSADYDNLRKIQTTSVVLDMKFFETTDNLVIGDSHAISLYRPGWNVNSVPFKTLHGALDLGLKSFCAPESSKYLVLDDLDIYFGNIDIRHHLLRQPNPEEATRSLVAQYFEQANELPVRQANIYEPLPINPDSRKVPQTGWYKGTPFFGTWEERNKIRDIFIEEAKAQTIKYGPKVQLKKWASYLQNEKGELDEKFMEVPQSVHLSRAAYPYWQIPVDLPPF